MKHFFLLLGLLLPQLSMANKVLLGKDDVIKIARQAGQEALKKSYAEWSARNTSAKWKPPLRTDRWVLEEPSKVTYKAKDKSWLVVWISEPPAGWTYHLEVLVNGIGKPKIIKAHASFASA